MIKNKHKTHKTQNENKETQPLFSTKPTPKPKTNAQNKPTPTPKTKQTKQTHKHPDKVPNNPTTVVHVTAPIPHLTVLRQ